MKGILLVSHGKLASGMKDTVELFSGKVEHLDVLELELEQEIAEFNQLLRTRLAALDSGQGVVVFCDLAFGTPSNLVAKLLGEAEYEENVQLITGMNLPMVLEYTQLRNAELDVEELIQIGREGILDFNEKLKSR